MVSIVLLASVCILSSLCNTAGEQVGRSPGAWSVSRLVAWRSGNGVSRINELLYVELG